VALAAIVPLGALALSARRGERTARSLGLAPAPRRSLLAASALAAAACALLGLAAAQPGLRSDHRLSVRSRSEILYVVDVSRSMAAAPAPRGTSRLARAREVVRRLHAGAADVPSGLAGLTDRVLPYLFPTADGAAFDETLRRSVLVEAPPPQETNVVATSFGALAALDGNGFFDRTARRHTCVLVTDGETRPYDTSGVAGALAGGGGCRLVVVRVGGPGDRVFGAGGVAEAGYAPDSAAGAKVEALATASGGRAFGAGDLAGAVRAVRAAAETGPVVRTAVRTTRQALAPWAALGALTAVLALLAVRIRIPGVNRRRRRTYDRYVMERSPTERAEVVR
jgi:hypothetical protein